ncbi:ornithine monooxygenase [Bacillus sp. FJAT-42376]|uniref:lysine N(6)-hydroxylase/L-ornithine N(5)-oxygenase family protein n=1 Tax=Bacillus sp. FJAT-42376 TaxID=2014076 RepID=UPI000F4F99EF|nr:SidA/IucD/PvdA family monooxygenase [Bacillus sp. FJAT-42376]AZB41666.1 ornithine monooxygenase [Bacillus sp. FJAT-42376]
MYDVAGIGIGPFNLSMAAMLEDVPEISAVFFDQKPEFVWHPGMLIEGTDLQVPFLADLVTFWDPKSPYTFLNYLHEQDRLYHFFFFRQMAIPRREYNDYGFWVAEQLESCRFSHEVISAVYRGDHYELAVHHHGIRETIRAKHVLLGTGSVPLIPMKLDGVKEDDVFHSMEYLYRAESLKEAESITVIGSGQSAAEIFHDLLKAQKEKRYHLTWFTRSSEFLQLESAKLAQEVFSPQYVEYFHRLGYKERMEAQEQLGPLRNGVDQKTLTGIYELLYHRSVSGQKQKVTIQPLTEVNAIKGTEGGCSLSCRQWQADLEFTHRSEKVVLATGYEPHMPEWLESMREDIIWEDEKRFKVHDDLRIAFKDERKNHLFTLTNIAHSHGTGATNLGLSVYRNQKIINRILGEERYKPSNPSIFQRFFPEGTP